MKAFNITGKPERALWLLLAVWWCANLIQAAFTGLANDEAYYWMFARDLDWGYFDHPPMTALLVKLGSFMGGELGIRFFFTLLQPLYLYIIYRIAKPAAVTVRDTVTFVTICAALPILQLYGFLAVPDGPLLFFSALFLLSFKLLTEKNRWSDALLMGISMGALAYSKYHGALIVVFALLSYPKVFRNPKLYVAALVTAAALVPHLLWQWQHDWVSFKYHLSGRNANFRLDYFTEYLLNVAVIFNPLFFPLYVKRWIRSKAENPAQRAIYTITLGFIVFFLVSSVRGYVQPQWVITSAFGAILLLWRYCIDNRKVERYTRIVGAITIGLVVLFRIEMIFNPLGIKFEIFDNESSYGAIAAQAKGRPVIFNGSYAKAAKYMYYTGGEAYCQASVSHRSSQWEFRDDDRRAAGREVIVETGRAADADSTIALDNESEFRYLNIGDFRPTREMIIDFDNQQIPSTVKEGDILSATLTVTNPYPYEVALSPDSLRIVAVLNKSTLTTDEVPVAFCPLTLRPAQQADVKVSFEVPTDMAPGKYYYGFTIRSPYMASWFNSPTHDIKIER